MNLDQYRIPLAPAPARIQALLRTGVQKQNFPAIDNVVSVLDGKEPPVEGVWRANDGKVLIVCNTDLPGVTPAMIDWWFGWHLPCSERYRLWHPVAHVSAVVRQDRSSWPDIRSRYIGNESDVDEYIGNKLKRLTIAFLPPEQFGFTDLDARGATAICGVTRERMLRADGGHLCHLILPTSTGSQMRSGFWLGEIHHHWGFVHGLFRGLINSSVARKMAITDQMCIDLLQHCNEEMVHLGKFLPKLYANVQQDSKI